MKKYSSIISVLACATLTSAYANYTYKPTTAYSGKWTEISWVNSVDGESYSWAEISKNGVCSEELVFDMNSMVSGGSAKPTFDSDITLSSLSILQKNNRDLIFSGNNTNTLKITTLNSLDSSIPVAPKTSFRSMNLEIETWNGYIGSLSFGGHGQGGGNPATFSEGRLSSLTIGAMNLKVGAASSPRAYTFISADNASVTGLITSTASSQTNLSYLALTNATTLSVGGIDGLLNFTSIATKEDLGSSYLVLQNAGRNSTGGKIIEDRVCVDSSYNDRVTNAAESYHHAKLGVKMQATNADAKQSFTGQSLFFTGGVSISQGSLAMNFDQKTDDYSYKSHFLKGKNSGNGGWFDYRLTEFTTTNAYKDITSGTVDLSTDLDTKTTASHGDLVLTGGTFENTRTTAEGNQSFRFTNINYTDGTVKLSLTSGSVDCLDLTDYYTRTLEAIHEEGTSIKLSYSVAYDRVYDNKVLISATPVSIYSLVKGGTVSIAENAKMEFDFSGSVLDWLKVDSAESENLGALIIAWSATQTDISESDFTVTDSSKLEGYNVDFSITDEGLYVRYVAVPEPSEYAAMFGALALAFVLYRRRK